MEEVEGSIPIRFGQAGEIHSRVIVWSPVGSASQSVIAPARLSAISAVARTTVEAGARVHSTAGILVWRKMGSRLPVHMVRTVSSVAASKWILNA